MTPQRFLWDVRDALGHTLTVITIPVLSGLGKCATYCVVLGPAGTKSKNPPSLNPPPLLKHQRLAHICEVYQFVHVGGPAFQMAFLLSCCFACTKLYTAY